MPPPDPLTNDARPTVTFILPHRETFGPQGGGAVAQVVHRLATGPSRYPSRVLGPAFPGPRFPGVQFHPMSALPWLPLSATQRYVAALAPHLARLPPGPIEVHNKPDVALWLSRLFPRRPVSLFLHNDPTTMRGARSPAARARLLRRLAHVAAVSGHIRTRFLAGLSTAPRPVTVLHNAIDPATIPPILPQPARDPVLLFVGRIVADKGADLFVAACAQALPHLPGWRAEMIGADGFAPGQPDTPFIRALRPAAAAAGVTLLGAKPPHAVLAAMARAAIVAVPSRWPEPFGLTALEALACGATLACSPRGGLPEIMGAAAVPIDPEATPAFAQALVSLASDPVRRSGLAAAGLQRVQKHFTLKDATAKLDALRDQATP